MYYSNFTNSQCHNSVMHEHVSVKQQGCARRTANSVFTELHRALGDEYRFRCVLVGSGKKGTVIRDAKGNFDLDYQLILTHNSKVCAERGRFDPTETKQRFMGEIQKILKSSRLEDSTTAITLNDEDSDFSIDFVIIDGTDDEKWKIIRRNNKNSKNEYTWNEMPYAKGCSEYYSSLEDQERSELSKRIIDAKTKDKMLPENKRTGSYILTIQAIKEHRDKHGHKG